MKKKHENKHEPGVTKQWNDGFKNMKKHEQPDKAETKGDSKRDGGASGQRGVRRDREERRGERRGERCRLQVPAGGAEPAGTPSQALPQSVMFSATLCEKCFGPPLSSATFFFSSPANFSGFFSCFPNSLISGFKTCFKEPLKNTCSREWTSQYNLA